MREFFSVVGVVFLAELADKTQLTVLGLSTGETSSWLVFTASSLGLILSTALAVVAGDFINQLIPGKFINYAVGTLFVGMGVWFLLSPVLE